MLLRMGSTFDIEAQRPVEGSYQDCLDKFARRRAELQWMRLMCRREDATVADVFELLEAGQEIELSTPAAQALVRAVERLEALVARATRRDTKTSKRWATKWLNGVPRRVRS